MTGALRVTPLDGSNAEAWRALFERAGVACFCRWWHFAGDKNDWLARCATGGRQNRDEAERAIAGASPEASGLVAMDGEVAVGWMKVAPRASLPKLRTGRAYRAIDLGEDDGVWSVGCFLVEPGARRRGVARALLEGAPAFVRSRGGQIIEAYPRHVHASTHPRLHDEEALMGPEALFVACGFVALPPRPSMTEAYPVYRRVVAP